jgi:hypothetical protein
LQIWETPAGLAITLQTISKHDNTGHQRSFSVPSGGRVLIFGACLAWRDFEFICRNGTRKKLITQIFELITGDYLFDPQSGTKYGKDDDHIAQIIELLGPFPRSLCLSGKWSQEIFNRRGELRNIHRLRHWALPEVLREKYHFTVEESKRISDFLLPMLELLPEDRANAGGMSSHAYLNSTPGMTNVDLDITPGTRGENIEGWAAEVKRR